jgi:hypothetical protein
VRGEVYGPECLSEVLGEEATPQPPRAPGRDAPARWVAFAFTLVALAGTALPWNRVPGAGFFGAWATTARWSMLAATAALLAVALSLFPRARRGPGHARLGQWTLAVLCAFVAAGALVHLLRPPPFTLPAAGAWVTLVSGVVATVCWVLAARLGRREERAGTG